MSFLTPLVYAVLTAQVAQAPPPRPASAISVEAATTITQGWALLAQGEVGAAADKASAALAASPRGAAALALAIEVEIARGGATAGLDFYERWLGNRTVEEAGILRRLSEAVLREAGADRRNPTARLEALTALAAQGDPYAAKELWDSAQSGDAGDLRALVAAGSGEAVSLLAGRLVSGEGAQGNRIVAIQALAASKRREGISALEVLVGDGRPEVRAEAALALGKLGSGESIGRLRALLSDPSSHVKTYAAHSLFLLGDDSGLTLLLQHARSEFPGVRIAAAEAMSTRPTPEWLELVRGLAAVPDAGVRLSAAKLLSPHDPEAARAYLEASAADPNPAIREEALQGLVVAAGNDLGRLRSFLKSTDRSVRIKAATRIFGLTS